jgi:hypothetical protein
MPKVRGQGFNKEKLVCVIASLLLLGLLGLITTADTFAWFPAIAVYQWIFSSAPPALLVSDNPVTRTDTPATFGERPPMVMPTLAGDLRTSPFMPTQYKQVAVVSRPKEPDQKAPPPPPPPPPQPKATPTAQAKPVTPRDKELEVEYVGVVSVRDQTYGLLKGKDGSCRRIREGDVIPGLNYKVTKVEKQAIYVQTEEGRVFILRSTAFGDVAAATPGGASTPPSTFTNPNPAPAPAPAPAPTPKQQPKQKTDRPRAPRANQPAKG